MAEIGASRKVVSESRERTFDHDVSDFAQLSESLGAMTRALCDSLSANARSGRTIGIKVRLDDWTTVTRAHSIDAPTCDYGTVSPSLCGCGANTRERGRCACSACAWPGGRRASARRTGARWRRGRRRVERARRRAVGLGRRRYVGGPDGVAGLTAVARSRARAEDRVK